MAITLRIVRMFLFWRYGVSLDWILRFGRTLDVLLFIYSIYFIFFILFFLYYLRLIVVRKFFINDLIKVIRIRWKYSLQENDWLILILFALVSYYSSKWEMWTVFVLYCFCPVLCFVNLKGKKYKFKRWFLIFKEFSRYT